MEKVILVVYLAVIVLMVAAMWKIFTKAGEPGWACLVPIYSTCVLLKIAGKPMWWFLLMLIPLVNIIIIIITLVGLSNKFGNGGGFAVGLF